MNHCPLIRCSRLILDKTLACLSLAALLSFLFVPSAHAGSWLFHVALTGTPSAVYHFHNGANSTTHTEQPWTPPADGTGSITLPGYGTATGGTSPPSNGTSCDASVTVPVTITVTWVPDPNLPSDPAPPSVKIIETSSATALGTTNSPNGTTTNTVGSPDDGLSGDPTNAQGVMSTA